MLHSNNAFPISVKSAPDFFHILITPGTDLPKLHPDTPNKR
ncbi:hypothetical protein O9A_00871 [Bartonella koehlerae C-29]|uniref:Uncharacterized protein n=1 Tax=Bartonella koehlerae C-29 TaxID=1134510 RepID=A0A067W9M8_9HYPH|nr:hypothetical protein O9A_00871 [Bartonella koehlerae C-29]